MTAPIRSLAVLVAVAVAFACDSAPDDGQTAPDRPAMGMEGMMSMMRNMPDGIAASELPESDSKKARLVARYCSQCHGIPTPRRLSAEEWSPTLRRMLVRMERMGRMPMHDIHAPSSEEAERMLRYLQTHALPTAPPESLPASDPAARLFSTACSRCHALPDPTQYPPETWPAVVERMRKNMRDMEVEGITDQNARRITEFLQQESARR